jgi:hypothetical protein
MAKKEQKIKTEFDNFWGDRIKEILDGSQVGLSLSGSKGSLK